MESQTSPAVPVPVESAPIASPAVASPGVESPGVASPAVESVPTLAEDLPEIYRAILDRVADLERIGARGDAGRIRERATRAYSDAWDESARRELLRLLAHAQRGLAITERPRGWSLRRRSVAAR